MISKTLWEDNRGESKQCNHNDLILNNHHSLLCFSILWSRLGASFGFEWPVVIAVTRLGDKVSKALSTFSSTRAISTLVVADIQDGKTFEQALDEAKIKYLVPKNLPLCRKALAWLNLIIFVVALFSRLKRFFFAKLEKSEFLCRFLQKPSI